MAAIGTRSRQRHPLAEFVIRRTLRLLVSLFVLVTAAFAMIQLVPGDPVRAALGDDAPAALVQARRHDLGLDLPLWEQFWHYLGRLGAGDLGKSMTSGLPVASIIGDRLGATATLAVLALVVVLLVSVPLGLAAAAFTRGGRRRAAELTFTGVTGIVALIPEFLLAVGLVWVFAVSLRWLPVAGQGTAASYILPVLALASGSAAALARIVRVEALKVLDQDYIRTARAKRLPARLIYLRHALPNLLTAVLTIGGLLVGSLIAGTVLVETVFAWPGLGTTIVASIQSKDYPLVQGIVLVYGSVVLVVNLVVDVLVGVFDRRSTIREG